jgi:hypothetical protein
MGPHLRTSGAERTEIPEKQKKVRAAFLSISCELKPDKFGSGRIGFRKKIKADLRMAIP